MEPHVGELVRRVFAIQEERQAEYAKLKSVQQRYSSQQWSLQQYQQAMEEVTGRFQALSGEVIALSGRFTSEFGLGRVAGILEDIQREEKEKLKLTVKLQVSLQQDKMETASDEESEDFDTEAHDRRETKKRLAVIEGAIAELLQDLRYECEPYLLQQTS